MNILLSILSIQKKIGQNYFIFMKKKMLGYK